MANHTFFVLNVHGMHAAEGKYPKTNQPVINVASLDQQHLGSVVVYRPFTSQINAREKSKG